MALIPDPVFEWLVLSSKQTGLVDYPDDEDEEDEEEESTDEEQSPHKRPRLGS